MGLADFLLGKKINTQNVEPSASYGQEVDKYLNTLGSQPYMQNLLNQPKEVGLPLEVYQRGVANGLNFGVPEISKMQDQLGIKKPQTEEEINLARLGDFNQPQGMNINVSEAPRRGGALNNFISGFRENFNNGFQPSNLEPANKTFSTRFGEGVGSLARFANSPVGRGVITAGLVLGTGGGALPALAFGGSATLGNQQYRLNDKMYRDDLIRSGREYIMNTPEYATADDKTKRAMLDEVDNRINGYRGYINKDIYRNMIDSQIAQENAAYRRMYYDNQRKQDELKTLLEQQQLDYKKNADAEDRALKRWELKIKEAQANGKPLSDTQVKNVKDLADSLNETEEIIAKYSNSKYNAGFGIVGAARRNPLTSKFDPLASEMRQDIDLFRKTVARAKEGGRLTDQDQKYYEKAVLNPNLSREDFISLAKEFQSKMERQMDTALDMYELQGKNVNNFRNYYENNKAITNEGWAF